MFSFVLNDIRSNAEYFGISTSTITGSGGILNTIIAYALAIIGFFGILAFVIAGVMYLVSTGDEDTTKHAKNYMIYAVIGITVALLGFVIMATISSLLGAGGQSYL